MKINIYGFDVKYKFMCTFDNDMVEIFNACHTNESYIFGYLSDFKKVLIHTTESDISLSVGEFVKLPESLYELKVKKVSKDLDKGITSCEVNYINSIEVSEEYKDSFEHALSEKKEYINKVNLTPIAYRRNLHTVHSPTNGHMYEYRFNDNIKKEEIFKLQK